MRSIDSRRAAAPTSLASSRTARGPHGLERHVPPWPHHRLEAAPDQSMTEVLCAPHANHKAKREPVESPPVLSARPGGFEPPTPGSVDRCSIQLSYGRK